MLIDLHVHTSGISQCCRIPFEEVLQEAKAHGMDGIVLTNHYVKSYVIDGKLDEFVERYIAEYEMAKEAGDRLGCKVFFGVEVSAERYPNVHLLVYGVAPSFLRNHPDLYEYTQKELYEAVKEAGGVLIQAHPFRNGCTVLDPAYLDGVEINCHPLYGNSYSAELLAIAKEHTLHITVGGDYHADTYRPKCGVILPDDLSDSIALGRYLLSDEEKKVTIQEPGSEEAYILSVY